MLKSRFPLFLFVFKSNLSLWLFDLFHFKDSKIVLCICRIQIHHRASSKVSWNSIKSGDWFILRCSIWKNTNTNRDFHPKLYIRNSKAWKTYRGYGMEKCRFRSSIIWDAFHIKRFINLMFWIVIRHSNEDKISDCWLSNYWII